MSEALRESALLLHGLSQLDRQWILSQLNAVQQAKLNQHLDELSQLGIPGDASLAKDVGLSPAARSAENNTPRSELMRASQPVLLKILSDEPSWMIAAVLSIDAWPWREALFITLDASKRERVKQALRNPVPPKLAHSIVAQMEELLSREQLVDAHHHQAMSGEIAPVWSRVREILQKWR